MHLRRGSAYASFQQPKRCWPPFRVMCRAGRPVGSLRCRTCCHLLLAGVRRRGIPWCSTMPTWRGLLEAGEVCLRAPAGARHASNSCDYGPALGPTIRSKTKRLADSVWGRRLCDTTRHYRVPEAPRAAGRKSPLGLAERIGCLQLGNRGGQDAGRLHLCA